MSETTWTWVLFTMELIGISGNYLVGNKKWQGHLIVALHSFPWAVYSIVFDKPGFLAMWLLWQSVHWRNMFRWKKENEQ